MKLFEKEEEEEEIDILSHLPDINATVITCIMILLLCAVCFGVGYYMAYDKAVKYTNEFVKENCEFEFIMGKANITDFNSDIDKLEGLT